MFTWTGALDRAAYAWRSALTITFMAATGLLFPYLSKAMVTASRCAPETCGAIGLMVSTTLRPMLFIVAIAMALSGCIRRARHAGLPAWLGAFPPLMFVGDQALLQYAGASWAYPFSAGVLFINPPIYALFGAALMGLLVVPSSGAIRGGGNGSLDRALLVLAAFLSVAAVVRAGGLPLFVFQASPLLALAVVLFGSYAAYAMPLFLALAVYRLWRASPVAPETPSVSNVVVSETPRLWQPGRAAAFGASLALAVVLWSLLTTSQVPFPWVLIGLVSFLLPGYLPTFVIYTVLAATIMRFVAKRDAIASAALLVALVPFGFWAASLSSVLMAKARERSAVAAIPNVALPAKVDAVVIEGDDWSLINCARHRILSGDYGVDNVLTHGQSKSPYFRFARATAKSPVNKGEATDSAPTDYVLVRFPRRPPFFEDRVSVDIAQPPVEIYAVGGSGRQFVAANYVASNPPPTFPPMLTTYGWYRGENSTTPEKACKSVANFLQRKLLDKLSLARG